MGEEYELLKKHRIAVENAMANNLRFFATELSSKDFCVVDVSVANEVMTPGFRTPVQKAQQLFNPLLDRVNLDPGSFTEFIEILKKQPDLFKVVISLLDKSKLICVR